MSRRTPLRLRQIRSTYGESEGRSLKVRTVDTTASVGALHETVNGPGKIRAGAVAIRP